MPMSRQSPTRFELRPAENVAIEAGRFLALTAEPWLEVGPVAGFRRGAAVEVAYSAGLTDRVARPVLQFRGRNGRVWNALLPAPSEGAGYWRGRVPPETVEIRVSPTDRPGAFDFAIEAVRVLTPGEMMRLRIASPRRGLFATGARLAQLREEADLNLRFVLERAEAQEFEAWRARRRRHAPAAAQAPHQVTISIGSAFWAKDLEETCASLRAQTHPDWRVLLFGGSKEATDWANAQSDPRIARAESGGDGFFMTLCAGDTLAPHALSAFLAEFARRPERQIVYSDDVRMSDGGKATPHFKPDWSPVRQAYSPYVGRAAMLRKDLALGHIGAGSPDALVDACLAETAPDAIGHIARALVTTVDAGQARPRRSRAAQPQPPRRRVTIVVPTRDRADLLERCLESVFTRTRHDAFEMLVIDNGSVEPATRALFGRMTRDEPRLRILSNPMPFNFSALCNFGAARAEGDVLVFLNNDTVILQSDWIERMLEFAAQPDVGAVGCKLVFPNGRVQHAGVFLGMGGVAGHFGQGMGRRAGGWLGGALGPYETSAVTAACMMVERRKFEAVGGFDPENLPVDLNDVDLCLRLDALGWRTICDCRTVLAHLQSASRGGALRLQSVYRKEREYFLARWSAAIRSDPFFNPNLSLYDTDLKLG